MKYVYPNNLMARRSESREVVKGGIFFAAFILIIAIMFLASDYSRSRAMAEPMIVCNGADASSCHIE